MTIQRIALLGATGSIGKSTLDVIRRNPQLYSLHAITANRSIETLLPIIREFQPKYVGLYCPQAQAELVRQCKSLSLPKFQLVSGATDIDDIGGFAEIDTVVAAIVGAAGLRPTMQAILAGKRVLLANKESLVMSGKIFIDAVRASGATLLPVDSEHNAVMQCLDAVQAGKQLEYQTSDVSQIILTASGGPFLTRPIDSFENISIAQACQHPNWSMGKKITVDSATMMNKGLELIEACWLFGLGMDKVSAVIHPQSIIHSLVQYRDGSTLAQLGLPDMRTPIATALAWPARIDSGVKSLDFTQISELTFSPIEEQRFPAYYLARSAFNAGGNSPAILNAANEVAVDAFLDGSISFTQIVEITKQCLDDIEFGQAGDLETILCIDKDARAYAQQLVKGYC